MKFPVLNLKPDGLLLHICQCLGMLSIFTLLFYNFEGRCLNCSLTQANNEGRKKLGQLLFNQDRYYSRNSRFTATFPENDQNILREENYNYRILTPMPPVLDKNQIPSKINELHSLMIVAQSTNPNLPSYIGGIFSQPEIGQISHYVCQLNKGSQYPQSGLILAEGEIKCPANSNLIIHWSNKY